MSFIDEMLDSVEIPRFVTVRQTFPRPRVADPAGELRARLDAGRYLESVKEGQSIAITAGSRGITNMPLFLKTLVDEVKRRGGEPFVFPAMGSHAGATAQGQKAMLEGMGITEEYLGAPIRSSMETVQIGESDTGRPVYLDKYADQADGIIVINRIKPHTGFRGKVESGLCKMCAIGMGKQRGADFCHAEGFGRMAENVPAIAAVTLAKKNILCCVGIIENAYHETAQLDVLAASEVLEKEPALLKRAWELMAKLPFDEFDVLIMDEIGKNISGTGFDTNVVGRYNTPYASGGPRITRAAALDITEASHGNGNGLGMLDVTTQRAYQKFSFEQTYPNCLTSTVPLTVKIPMVLKSDRQAIQGCIKTCNVPHSTPLRAVRIKNTLLLTEFEASEGLIPQITRNPNLEIVGSLHELPFDSEGNLF
ncbi:MAG: lactate racemase domain-containing protein [Pyramidobacter sp.]|nr:lactate racemase domain-containing protein [Pyramidobacter sp.]